MLARLVISETGFRLGFFLLQSHVLLILLKRIQRLLDNRQMELPFAPAKSQMSSAILLNTYNFLLHVILMNLHSEESTPFQ